MRVTFTLCFSRQHKSLSISTGSVTPKLLLPILDIFLIFSSFSVLLMVRLRSPQVILILIASTLRNTYLNTYFHPSIFSAINLFQIFPIFFFPVCVEIIINFKILCPSYPFHDRRHFALAAQKINGGVIEFLAFRFVLGIEQNLLCF
jgi:hypothetical protein